MVEDAAMGTVIYNKLTHPYRNVGVMNVVTSGLLEENPIGLNLKQGEHKIMVYGLGYEPF